MKETVAENKKIILRPIDKIFIVWFFISCLHSVLGLLFYISLIIYWQKYGTEGGIKALIFVTTRGILGPAVAATPAFGMFRWIIIIGSATWVLMQSHQNEEGQRIFVGITCYIVLLACIAIISALGYCSYPITSLFKLLSFSMVFLSVIKGISITSKKVDWNDFLLVLYAVLFLISLLLIPFDYFRTTNDNFQGVFNHVNLLGVVGALFVAIILKSTLLREKNFLRWCFVLVTLIMIFLSASRTGMFSAILVIFAYSIWGSRHAAKSHKWFIGILIVGFILLFFGAAFMDEVYEFVYKDGTDSILASREEIAELYIDKFQISPVLGTGFMVPHRWGKTDWSLSMDLIVEPGNLIWTLLGDLGILGLIIFSCMFLTIAFKGKKQNFFLLIAVFSVCMGEMLFFSPNNMSVLLYVLIGVYLFGDKEDKQATIKAELDDGKSIQ